MKTRYYTYNGIKRNGPYTINELKKLNIYADSKIWKEGTEDWTRASEFQELHDIIQARPPSRIKPLSYFIKNTSELKLKATVVITIIVYLITALFLNGGLETLMFKFNNQELFEGSSQQIISPIQEPRLPELRGTDTTKMSGMSKFLMEANRGLDSLEPTNTASFKKLKDKKTIDPSGLRVIDADVYRDYIPDFDPDDPNLNRLLSQKLNAIIANAFWGPITILITIVTFAISMILNNFKYEDFRTYVNQYRDIMK